MTNLYEIASLIQVNNKDEALAISGYSQLLDRVVNCKELADKEKAEISFNIREIIADELNHQEKLQKLYTMLTLIKPNKD